MIKIITGVMTSGKSERLIEKIDKCHVPYLILKPSLDTRDGAKVKTRSHSRSHHAVLVDESNPQLVEMVFKSLGKYGKVFIDEAQFFTPVFIRELINLCYSQYVDLVASGLMKNFKGEYFPSMELLSRYSDKTETLLGHCFVCEQKNATIVVLMDRDGNILTEGETVQIEGETSNFYENLCDKCYEVLK